jgi:methionyl-tRNA formyltransferase
MITQTRVLFLGSHLRCGECLRYFVENIPNADVVGLVLNKSDAGDYDHTALKTQVEKYNIPVIPIEGVASLRYDLGISILYDRKLPTEIVDQPPRGLVNIHLGPLPRFRGVNCIYHAIRRARSDNNWVFGITLHYIDHGLDTGPIIDAIDIPMLPHDTAYDLYMRATEKILALFSRNIGRLVSSRVRVPATPQIGPSYYFKRSDMELEVDLNSSPEQIYDAIRALTFPGKSKPFALIGGRKIHLSLDGSS